LFYTKLYNTTKSILKKSKTNAALITKVKSKLV
jgi:hypothetical protein